MSVDTTTEEVERLALLHERSANMWAATGGSEGHAGFHRIRAATLRALVAERDALKAELGGSVNSVAQNLDAQLRAALAERDEARNGAVAASECAGRMMQERDDARLQNEAIKADLAACLNERDEAYAAMEQAQQEAEDALADRDAARAEVARLREALGAVARSGDYPLTTRVLTSPDGDRHADAIKIARAALAQKEGGDE